MQTPLSLGPKAARGEGRNQSQPYSSVQDKACLSGGRETDGGIGCLVERSVEDFFGCGGEVGSFVPPYSGSLVMAVVEAPNCVCDAEQNFTLR